MILLSISCMTTFPRFPSLRHHADPFYNYNDNNAPGSRLPLIDPYEAERWDTQSPWKLNLMPNGPYVAIPNSNDYYPYTYVEELEKFSVTNDVILAYSSYVDKDAEPYIQNNYYHWFVIVPDKNTIKGFHAEDEFDQYIQTLGIQDPEWQTPDEAFDKYFQTGCLDWIPDCK